jgi:hypothetical protein
LQPVNYIYNLKTSSQEEGRVDKLADGEPMFFGIALFFAALVLLGIAANLGWVPM